MNIKVPIGKASNDRTDDFISDIKRITDPNTLKELGKEIHDLITPQYNKSLKKRITLIDPLVPMYEYKTKIPVLAHPTSEYRLVYILDDSDAATFLNVKP